jgi:hypothetical protein
MFAPESALDWPDGTLLPAQMPVALDAVATTGVKGLMIAVLEDAITCLSGAAHEAGGRARLQAVAAAKWIRSRDASWPFSFQAICDVLSLDGDRLRRHLLDAYARRQPALTYPHASARRMDPNVRRIVVVRRRRRRRRVVSGDASAQKRRLRVAQSAQI